MGRPTKDRRGNYRSDTRQLANLKDAVLADSKISPDKRTEVVRLLNSAFQILDEVTCATLSALSR